MKYRAIKSLAIIPDGNRRCAMRLLKKPWKGHEWGVGKIKKVFEWCKEFNIKTTTFYVLSLENFKKRPKYELDFLYTLARKELRDVVGNKDNFVHKNKIRMRFFGRLELLPTDLQELIEKTASATRDYHRFTMNLAIAYGGRQEIIDAFRNLGVKIRTGKLKPEDINESVLRHSLYTNGTPDPDLIIRTGGEERLSNFLLFQSAYSELAFVKSYWPDFSKKEFVSVIRDFTRRERRFGK